MKWLFASVLGITACAYIQPPAKESPQVAIDRATVGQIDELRKSGQSQVALDRALSFIKEQPNSTYLQAARLQEGQALEQLGKPAEAEEIYKDIREKTLVREPRIAAYAEWRLSFTAEQMGDDLRSLSHVIGAENLRRNLPQEIAMVEIPARKALMFHRTGKFEAAEKAVTEAQNGLRSYLSGDRRKPSDAWMAALYLEMGRSVATVPDAGNFVGYLQAQRVSQDNLLAAMRYGDPAVSPQAADLLKTNYASLWQSLQQMTSQSADLVESRKRRNQQILLGAEFLKVLEDAQNRRPVANPSNSWETDVFAYVEQLSIETKKLLYANAENTVLTHESQVLNGLRRDLQKTPSSQEPNAQEQAPLKPDPNL